MTSEQIELVARIIDPSAWEEIDRREALNSDPEYRRAYETSASLKGINAVPWDQVRARLAAPTLEKAARIIASLAPAVPEGWEREARQHIVELEQCSLFVDSAPLAKAMTNAADFLRKLATSDARPLPTEGDAGRAALEAEKTTHQEPKHER